MTDSTDGFAALADRIGTLLASIRPLPRWGLHCSPEAIPFLKMLLPASSPPLPRRQTPFAGLPVISSPDLGEGEWELREDGKVICSGRFRLPDPASFASYVSEPLPYSEAPPFSLIDRLAWANAVRRPYRPVLGSVI